METKTYSIVIHCWAPIMQEAVWTETVETKWGEKTFEKKHPIQEYIGGRLLIRELADLDEAKKEAAKLWLDESFKGTMKEVKIFSYGWGEEGKSHLLFHSDNFDKFAAGSKQREGTPF